MKGKSNEQLMKQLQESGDERAFIYLYERYKKPIFNYVLNFVRSREMAIEITQDVFTKVYSRRDLYNGDSKFTTWLWSIARNQAIDSLRRKDALNYTTNLDMEDSVYIETVESEASGPELELIVKVDKAQVEEAIGKLSDSQRDALSMRVFSELSYEEIAKSMEITVPAVKSLIFRAKKILVEEIKKYEDE